MSLPNTPDPDSLDSPINRILAEYLAAEDAGNAPSVEELIARYPDFAREIREFVKDQRGFGKAADILEAAANLGPKADHEAPPPTPTPTPTAPSPEATTELGRPAFEGELSETVDRDPNATAEFVCESDPNTTADHSSQPGQGTRVHYFGDYELIQVLGQGGMGVVYKARQISLNRLVALKMIRSGELADADELRRFQNEAEAVAHLEHPGILPILEVGEHDGRRYFSMPLMAGGSLNTKLANYTSDPRSAARLVADVADAVHHAHQRGLLHRDLKPANILLDDDGHPHVTDFGLARWIEGESELTQSGAIVGTPAYMAPEQASGNRRAVTTSSDVYGLGTILYALLRGQGPFSGTNTAETLRRVREDAPEPVRKYNPRVSRGLETIVLKCLEKDPKRRYESAAALAHDLRNYLENRPLLARPVGPVTRLALWCKRHPAQAVLAGALGLSMLGGGLGVILQWRRANQESFNRERINRFFLVNLLGRGDPGGFASNQNATIRELFENAARQVGTQLQEVPQVEADERYTIGTTLNAMGRYEEAEPHLRRALELFQNVSGKQSDDAIACKGDLARLLVNTNRIDEAASYALEAYQGFLEKTGPRTEETISTQILLGSWQLSRGLLDDAEKTFRDVLDVLKTGMIPSPKLDLNPVEVQRRVRGRTSDATILLANVLLERNKMAEAEKLQREVLHERQKLHGPDHPRVLVAQQNLYANLVLQGKFEEAERELPAVIAKARKALGDQHPHTLQLLNSLGAIELFRNRFVSAEKLIREAVAGCSKLYPDHHREMQSNLSNLAKAYEGLGRFAEAEELLRRVLNASSGTSSRDASQTAMAQVRLVQVLCELGKFKEALPLISQALPVFEKTQPANSPTLLLVRQLYGWVLLGNGRGAEAEPILRNVLEARRKTYKKGDYRLAYSESLHGGALIELQRLDEAEAELLSAHEALTKSKEAKPARLQDTRRRLETLYKKKGDLKKAATYSN